MHRTWQQCISPAAARSAGPSSAVPWLVNILIMTGPLQRLHHVPWQQDGIHV